VEAVDVMTAVLRPQAGTAPIGRAEAEDLIFTECRLLDELRYEEWLELFTSDGLYWLPIVDCDVADADKGLSIVYDDSERRAERVYRTLHTPVLDQSPRSRTVHLAGNVEVADAGDPSRALVRCSMIIAELRPGGDRQLGLNRTRVFAGRCEYRLRRDNGAWRIELKKLLLIDSDRPLYNLTFIL
jgi:3-phenylpropionate/cinnamic acid dioxygenase small subunit